MRGICQTPACHNHRGINTDSVRMEITCHDGLSGRSEVVEVSSETASQLLTQVCALFGRTEEDAALEVDGEVVWVGGQCAPEVPLRSLSLGRVVLRRGLERVLSMARDWEQHDDMPWWAWEERVVVMEAVRSHPSSLEHAGAWRNDREIVLEAVKRNGRSLAHAGHCLRSDREVVITAVRQCGAALEYTDDFRNDRALVLEAVRQSWTAFEFADDFRNDREVALEAVKQCGFSMVYADESLRTDRAFVLEAARHTGSVLEYVAVNRALVLEAVRQAGTAFWFTGDFRDDREVALEAVKQCASSFEFAGEGLRRDRTFVLEAVRLSGGALELRSNGDVVEVELAADDKEIAVR
eukprot:Rhum_TRINITY_DN14648_c5_g1::Rhum_TRINITY_DN14648_c5_g1_i1::g.107566::m.107566